MPFCAVRTCGESGQFACKKSEGQIISFHRFPPDCHIKAKWIEATGQRKTTPSWQPTKASTICSKHFKKEDFLDSTDLKISAVPISEEEQETSDGFLKDSVDNSDTDSVDDIIELPQHNQSITNKELTEEDEKIPIEAPTTSPDDQPEPNQPIAVQDSEPEFSETSSELEFTELDYSEAKSGQPSVDAIEIPTGSDEEPAYGMKISKVYSTRKRSIEQMKGQMKTNIKNIKMYRMDPVTNTVRPVTSIPKDSYIIDSAKPPVLIRKNRGSLGKPIYLINKASEALDGNSPKTKANQNCSSQVQYANSTTKNIAPERGSNSHRVITLSRVEEPKKVYSTPVPKLAPINQDMPAKEADIIKIWKPTQLNATTETAGRVNNHRKLTFKSVIKKMPSANVSTAPDGCCGPQLKLAVWNVSKPKLPRRSAIRRSTASKLPRLAPAIPRSTTSKLPRLAPAIPRSTTSKLPGLAPAILRPTTSVATPADSMPTSTVSTPISTVSTPSPTYSMPTPADSTPTPANSTPLPAHSMPTPADSTPKPADATPKPADSMPTSTVSTPISTVSTPSPAYSMPTPADSTPTNSTPSPAHPMPTSTVSTPSTAFSTPKPADSTPKPADSTPSPVHLMPTPADSTPTPADSTPTAADSTPSPVHSMPTSTFSTPTSTVSIPTSTVSTPTPADSMRTPADSMPIRAVSSPAVQKLDDSNIHTLDEYDTFAKHVAAQLRQLSLESYLSAQGEIQGTLSRYRLRDLNLIKKNPNL